MPANSPTLLFAAILTFPAWFSVSAPAHGEEKDTPAKNRPAVRINENLRQKLLARSKEAQPPRRRPPHGKERPGTEETIVRFGSRAGGGEMETKPDRGGGERR